MNGAAATLGLYHPTALVESGNVGEGTRIWAFAHVLPGAVIGRDCNICDHTFVENDVIVGDRVTIKCGVQLWDGVRLMDDVFVGPNATFTNDPFPRSGQHQDRARMPRTLVKRGASIGANATILPGITIGGLAMVGAGSVVTRDVPAETVVAGNPAAIIGYAGAVNRRSGAVTATPLIAPGCVDTSVRGVVLQRLSRVQDMRGHLSFGETNQEIPFEVRRYFVVFGVSGRHIRGEHAHRRTHQFLVCVAGSCHVVADDGESREEFVLDDPSMGLFLPAMTWAVQYKYSPDAVLMVLASEHYDADDYIRSYDEFRVLRRRGMSAEAGA